MVEIDTLFQTKTAKKPYLWRGPYLTACRALRSRTGLQGFRSEIGYQIFDQVWNWVGKIKDFGLK